jgi:hypothetical protein
MAQGLKCIGILSETRPILPIASQFAHPDSLIWKDFENNHTLFRILLDSFRHLLEYSGTPVKSSWSTWEHIALHSAYLGVSGRIWKDQCGCAELLSCSVMTSKPFDILMVMVVLYLLCLMLTMGLGNQPEVQVENTNTVWLGSKTIQKPYPLCLGRANLNMYLSTRSFCWVWIDPCVPIPSSVFRVFLLMVAFRYPTTNHKIITLV